MKSSRSRDIFTGRPKRKSKSIQSRDDGLNSKNKDRLDILVSSMCARLNSWMDIPVEWVVEYNALIAPRVIDDAEITNEIDMDAPPW